MHLHNPFPLVSMFLYASSITLIVELRYSIALTLCWSYYYDPRCLRGSSSNLAMICVPSVMILAIILESIPWCYLVVGILSLGFEPEIHSTYFMLIAIASAFRILVTFAIVLEVRGIFFFQIPWTNYGRSSSLNWNITTGLFLTSSPLYIVALPVLSFCMGYPEEICWTWFDILIYASTTQKVICSFELFSLVAFWPSSINW